MVAPTGKLWKPKAMLEEFDKKPMPKSSRDNELLVSSNPIGKLLHFFLADYERSSYST
jgi:hypothetical protein